MSDAVLNDDPCLPGHVREVDRYDYVERWLPPRTDCRITTPGGASRIESGSSEVFLATFGLVLVAGLAIVSAAAPAVRAVALLGAGAAALLVIFIV